MNAFRRITYVIFYALQKRWLSIGLFVLVASAAIWLYANDNELAKNIAEAWEQKFNTWISLSTLIVAFAVWCAEIAMEWRNSIPKRLTVNFLFGENDHQKKVVMRCEKAHLADIADIRSLGQQIGSQLVNQEEPDRTLSFIAPFVHQQPQSIEYDKRLGFFSHYRVEFILTKLPAGLNAEKCKVWRAPFHKDDISTCAPILP